MTGDFLGTAMNRECQMTTGQSTYGWTILELSILAAGLAGSATACLANYNWHWFRESVFYMAWSATPFILLGAGSHIAGRIVRSPALRPVTTLLALLLAFLSLAAYVPAVLHPNHSSGMIFAVLPLCWMIGIPAVLTVVTVCFQVAESWRRRGRMPK
jgi:hypothetical protein